MKILIIYETYSGGTKTAVEFMAEELIKMNHAVDIIHAIDAKPDSFSKHDLYIFATPSWLERDREGQPHINFIKFMEKFEKESFENKNIALMGLGDATYAHFCGGIDVLMKFLEERGGKILASPLKLDSYFMKPEECRKIMKEWISKFTLKN
ncbi:hypothetical protein A3A93_03825 [Candidatus Roizmanbacteria bacterium RIFCSPLOWO2_01_FULL_38_12]|uniref:Flavodoxin-like domain-containing protein n=1 Tax=Candidatus Roizmanbacteria bacterium RIFCSPLOWO2_01_FULL_38_12 TaxID=1802061 RepID=A0A1F7IYZ6_9BACT|nr:MAG: hypothetical protein A2861_04165 [Candidatus Roizmanbacteria bacterium RIFCSPHIGHO2_01_FULL_38_15]OGK34943.1 MAG: hypothetical protein A3F59_03775 [Candidatus Roizmanbacteria bacterium RIFCSPHIGHO2_12_FULL_38_13]OGK48569.1 MAG: hypothetical protein A3A93_03825 [Candidatus Roizmanbacteria bacterium RIFCSPLOWO2_01_FULL_38_12]